MSKNTDDYEAQVLKEFENTQEPEKKEAVKDLGKVEINQHIDDPELERIKSSFGTVGDELRFERNKEEIFKKEIKASFGPVEFLEGQHGGEVAFVTKPMSGADFEKAAEDFIIESRIRIADM